MQPNWLFFRQRRADGSGADGLLAEFNAYACNGIDTAVVSVYKTSHINHNAVGVCDHGKKRSACNRASKSFQFGMCGSHQFTVLIQGAAYMCLCQRIKSHLVVWLHA